MRKKNGLYSYNMHIYNSKQKKRCPGSRSRSKTAQDMSGLSGFSARFERFGRFGRFFGKPAQTAQILLKKPLKNRSFLAVIFERFFEQDLSGFGAVFERSYKENRIKPTKRPGKVMWLRVDIHKSKMLILNFPTTKKLIIPLPASNVWKNANHTIFIQFQKTIEKRFNLISPAIWTKYNSLVIEKNYFCFFLKKNSYHTISIYEKNVYSTISIYEKTLILEFFKQFSESMKL